MAYPSYVGCDLARSINRIRHPLYCPPYTRTELNSWYGEPFFTAQWWTIPVIDFKASTPLIFDIGVYLVVLGSVLTAITALVKTDQADDER